MTHHQLEAGAADLVEQLSEQTSRLVSQELELAQAELTIKGKRARVSRGASVLGLYALGALTAAVITALSLAMATWLAALIVAVIWGVAAAIVALMGTRKVDQALPPIPEDSVESAKEDVRWTRHLSTAGSRS